LIFKAGAFVFGPLPTILFCFSLSAVFANIGIIGAGVIYGFLALGKKADRSEMARNAQVHAPNMGPTQPVKVTVINDRNSVPPPKPPPPSYSDSYSPGPYTFEPQRNNMSGGHNLGWDTSYLQSSTTDLQAPSNGSTKPTDTANPFH